MQNNRTSLVTIFWVAITMILLFFIITACNGIPSKPAWQRDMDKLQGELIVASACNGYWDSPAVEASNSEVFIVKAEAIRNRWGVSVEEMLEYLPQAEAETIAKAANQTVDGQRKGKTPAQCMTFLANWGN